MNYAHRCFLCWLNWSQVLVLWGVVSAGGVGLFAAIKDTPFPQDFSVQYGSAPELQGAVYQKLAVNKDGVTYVLTDKGVARLFEATLALDRSFRPLTGRVALDLTVQNGEVFYLFADRFLANGFAGRIQGHLPAGQFSRLSAGAESDVLVTGPTRAAWVRAGAREPAPIPGAPGNARPFQWGNDFFLLTDHSVHRVHQDTLERFHEGTNLSTLAFRGSEMLVGTRDGFYGLDLKNGRVTLERQTRLPFTDITCLVPVPDGLWVGTTRGVFHQNREGTFRYYASRRWLSDDDVVDVRPGEKEDVYVLTRTGLNRIGFEPMTLAEKAQRYERKIRQRHIRFGFCSELRLLRPGEITSAEMIDTDNDGTWSNYYLASQAFRFGATGDGQARSNAWETFAALERLESINGLKGFPSRTFERAGFKFSDPDRWRPAPDADWEWKATTSSDELTAHTFGCSVLYECVARTPEEKERVVRFYDKLMSHIVEHDLYLIDWDGKPTLWGRWNPAYVNSYPPTISDRRLNSAEILGALQFAHRITGRELYRRKAFELIEQHGYLQNVMNSMKRIALTPGYVHEGNDMGNEWNHSDDLLSFVAYWVLHRYAFNPELKAQYAAAIQDHFEIEKNERCPIWNFVYAATGASDYDVEGALWTLRRFPLDLISWNVANSHRKDVTRLPENFRHQQLAELLPPSERHLMRWNGHPFTLDGGDGGRTELAGDEFLLPYWMGRYLKIIE